MSGGEVVGMVLCAGLGKRLRPLTERLPKPAVPVCGVPLVRWTLGLLAGAGVRRAVVNVHHLPDVMDAVARAAAAALGLDVAVSREPVIAGTGGALREARALLGGASAVVLVNGDVLFDLDVGAVVAAHRRSGALATMVLAPMPAGARYAAVEVDPAGAVRRIAGAFGPGGDRLEPRHFTGVHVLDPAVLAAVPETPFEVDINRHVYPPLMGGGHVRGLLSGGYWNDLGTPARYLAANDDVLSGRVPLARFGVDPLAADGGGAEEIAVRGADVSTGAVLRGPVAIGPGAVVGAGAVVGPRAYVGGGARIGAGARVVDAVVWDGTEVAPGERVEGAVAAGPLRVPAPPER